MTRSGRNQHRNRPLIEEHPDLPDIIQGYVNDGVRQIDMPRRIEEDHGYSISLRSVKRIARDHNVQTTRRNDLTPMEKGVEILKVAEDDGLNRWGARLMKEKLGQSSVHISRDFITEFRRIENPEASAARHPITRKVHHHGLWSIGPNEEWCVDGHEKLVSMGIAVWGVVDKFSRLELGLWAVPNARLIDVPPCLMLRLIMEKEGMSLTTTMDKGSELGKLITLLTTLRFEANPHISEEDLPTCKAVKSVHNITRERSWRPLWEKELGNILHEYNLGLFLSGFQSENELHSAVSLWIWGRITQDRLDKYRKESAIHHVRKQAASMMPTGGRREDFYKRPEEWGGDNQLIPVPKKKVVELLATYDRADLLQFGSDDTVQMCERAYAAIGSPACKAKDGWGIFQAMVEHILNCKKTDY